MGTRRIIFTAALAVLAVSAVCAAGASARAARWLTIYSPNTHLGLEPGSLMYYNTAVEIEAAGFPEGGIGCQQNIAASDATNSQKVDRVNWTGAADPFCGEEMKLKSLPDVLYRVDGRSTLTGKFEIALPELGCVYKVKNPKMTLPFGNGFEGLYAGGVATRVPRDSNPENCPETAAVEVTVYGVYEDEEQQYPLAWTVGEA